MLFLFLVNSTPQFLYLSFESVDTLEVMRDDDSCFLDRLCSETNECDA